MHQDRKCSFRALARHCPVGRRQSTRPSVDRATTSKLSKFRVLMQHALKRCMEKSSRHPNRSIALGGDLIEVEHPSNHPIPPSYEYELFSNPNPLGAAWGTNQASLFPIVHHPIEKLPRKHLTRAPLRAATEISVGVLAVLVVVPILLRKWTIVILVSLTNGYRTEQNQCDGETDQRFHLVLLLSHRSATTA